jgi:hypothetical protein
MVALQLAVIAFGPGWKFQALSLLLMGWGFYMIHGCMQVFASELSVEARATALALHSFFFFMGQTVGPIAYGFGIQNVGKVPTLLASAVVMVALGIACARFCGRGGPPIRVRRSPYRDRTRLAGAIRYSRTETAAMEAMAPRIKNAIASSDIGVASG